MMTTEDLIHFHVESSKLELIDEPTEDLVPLLVVEGGEGKLTLAPIYTNVHPYDVLMAIAEKIRTELQPVRVSARVDSYVATLDPVTERRTGDRREAIIISVVSIEGQTIMFLPYERTPDGIVFEEPLTTDEVDGRIIDALRSMLVTHRDPD